MAKSRIHVADTGTEFEVTIVDCQENAQGEMVDAVVDASSATIREIILEKPDGTTMVKPASFKTDGTDGVIRFFTVATDLDTPGKWRIQGRITMPTGKWHTNIAKFTVYENL